MTNTVLWPSPPLLVWWEFEGPLVCDTLACIAVGLHSGLCCDRLACYIAGWVEVPFLRRGVGPSSGTRDPRHAARSYVHRFSPRRLPGG